MKQYTTKSGDTVDYICWKEYGKTSGIVEKVLEANKNLAKYGIILPEGLTITLPDIQESIAETGIRLWD